MLLIIKKQFKIGEGGYTVGPMVGYSGGRYSYIGALEGSIPPDDADCLDSYVGFD